MNVKTRNSIAWLALGLSSAVTAWVVYDAVQRYQNLVNAKQEFSFGQSSDNQQIDEASSLKDVINAHLFGVQPVAAKVEKPKVVNAPKTRLKLKLTGLIATSSPDSGFAVIEITRGETSVVGVGKKIGKTGAKLHAIESDHVLINHNGKIEKLPLEREILSTSSDITLTADSIKALDLSESELATLTQIGQTVSSEEQQVLYKSFIEAEQIDEDNEIPGEEGGQK